MMRVSVLLVTLFFQSLPFGGIPIGGGGSGTNVGLDFRSNCSYVTDPANNTCVQTGDPGAGDVTRNGITFSITALGSHNGLADRDDGTNPPFVDHRLAGMLYVRDDQTPMVVKLVLGATGTFNVAVALGDYIGAQGQQHLEIYDGDPGGSGTLLATINKTSVGQAHWFDASGVERTSSSDWVTNNATLSLAFTTDAYFKVGAGSGSASEYTVLGHVHVH